MASESQPPAYAAPTPSGYTQNYTYIPTHQPGEPSISLSTLNEHYDGDDSTTLHDGPEVSRTLIRTPSPTVSEYNALNNIKVQRTTRQNIIYYSVLAVVITIAIVFSIEHDKIINALKPETNWLADHPAGFLIPIAIFIILSFPPLFGHEIVAMLVGVTWPLAEAFAITAVGTLLGEIANYFVFKYCCTARSEKMEKTQISYALLAHVVREGGFLVVLVIRFSAVPSHFATAIFSTVGISFLVFIAAAVLSLPKPLVPVYFGYALKPGVNSSASKTVDRVVLAISILVTLAAYYWLRKQQELAKPVVIYARRKARQEKLLNQAQSVPYSTPYNVDEPYNPELAHTV